MQSFCSKRPDELKTLCGFVFKSRSPSCGLRSTPVFIDGDCVTDSSRGLFARAMTDACPTLPVVEETDLESSSGYERFVESVFDYMESTDGMRGRD